MITLPDLELETFLATVTEAIDAAGAGEPAGGYNLLLAGLQRAQQAAANGEPWGPELVRRYSEALDNYIDRW